MSNWDFGYGLEPADAGEPYEPNDPQAEPYPITYERDDSDGDPSWPAAPPPPPDPWPAEPRPTEHRQPPLPPPPEPWPAAQWSATPRDGLPYGDESWLPGDPEAEPRRAHWLIPAAVAVASAVIGAAAVLLAGAGAHPGATATAAGITAGTARPTTPANSAAGRASASQQTSPQQTPAGQPTAAAAAPLTLATAQGALAGYTTVNNGANAQRSDSELAMAETGGSYAIDSNLYAIQRAAGTAPYPAFSPVRATYYIPRAEAAGGPRWFVVAVANAFSAHPKQVTSTEYLLFTQATPGGSWQNAVEPYLLPGADAPQITIGGNGLATAVSATATSLAAAPGQLAGLTAASLDGTGGAVSVADPGDLADRFDRKFWQGKLPTATATDAHAAATGPEGATFALLTTDGGALVFYTDSAELTITGPDGSRLHLTVPGLYSPAQSLTSADLTYLDQFAAYDPPANAGPPTVIAAYSGLTGKN